jgi:hypothetical protein
MPRGVWKDTSIAKRSAAARKGALSRRKGAAGRIPTRSECDATRGSQAHKVLAGSEISAMIDRIRARSVEQGGDVSQGTEATQ